jgi:hypothetical protein
MNVCYRLLRNAANPVAMVILFLCISYAQSVPSYLNANHDNSRGNSITCALVKFAPLATLGLWQDETV